MLTGKTITIFCLRRLRRLRQNMSLFCPEPWMNFICKRQKSCKRSIFISSWVLIEPSDSISLILFLWIEKRYTFKLNRIWTCNMIDDTAWKWSPHTDDQMHTNCQSCFIDIHDNIKSIYFIWPLVWNPELLVASMWKNWSKKPVQWFLTS